MATTNGKRLRHRRGANDGVSSIEFTSNTFEKALNAFLLSQDAAGHSKVSQSDYKSVISSFLRYMTDEHKYTHVHQIAEVDILGWLSHLRSALSRRGSPYSSRSIETYSRDVFSFLRWLFKHDLIPANPVAQMKMPKVEKALIRVFTEEELERLDAACDRPVKGHAFSPDERKALSARDRAFLWLLLSTGVRLSEARGLLFSDVDWNEGMIYVRGKGAKERRIPIGKVARQHLNTYIQYWRGAPATDGDEHVFLNAYGGVLQQGAVNQIFVRLKRVAGITDKRVSAHTCRHWFAVNMIKRGLPSTVLQSLLGHETLEMINTYVRLADQDKQELYTKFSPVDALEMHHSTRGKRQQARDWRNARKQSKK